MATSDYTRIDWQALSAARKKCRQNVVEGERSGDASRLHTAYKLSQFLAEALPDAWDAAEERAPDALPDEPDSRTEQQ